MNSSDLKIEHAEPGTLVAAGSVGPDLAAAAPLLRLAHAAAPLVT